MYELCEAYRVGGGISEIGGAAHLDADSKYVEAEPTRIREIDDIP